MSETVFIGLGSNVEDKKINIDKAMDLLKEKVKIIQESSLYETEPKGIDGEEWFFNSVVKAETDMTPKELLKCLLSIEKKLGREKNKKGPRIIDLDILFYGNQMIEEKDLTIPHPDIAEKGFVLVPLVEIAPDFIHPKLNKKLEELEEELDEDKQVIKI
jgi:2-amino-4-hydroxy-6-hydroxymethyldihydropteridine diphosphokinase